MTTPVKSKQVQTPGEDPAAVDDAVLDTGNDAIDEAAADSDAAVIDQANAVEDSALDKAMAALHETKLEVQRLEMLLNNAGIDFKTKQQVKEAKLPDQKDVDPKKIKTKVLTKQGWVMPETK